MALMRVFSFVLWLLSSSVRHSTTSVSKCRVHEDATYHGLYVDCHDKGLIEIPQDFPANTSSINLSYNKIRTVKNYSFSTVHNLVFLNLEHNDISHLEDFAFVHCKTMKSLGLKENNARLCCSGKIFDSLTQLHFLSIDGCYTRRIFKNLHKLMHFEVNSNGILNFEGFGNLQQLRYIGIEGAGDFQNDTFKTLNSLKIEKLCIHARITHLETDTFSQLSFIRELSMINTYRGVRSTLYSLYGLVKMNLTTLELNGVSYDAKFETLQDTEELIVKKEDMKYLVDICVERLILSNNYLLYMDQVAIEKSSLGKCLTHLDVSRNRLSHFTFDVLFHLPLLSSLRYLDISEQDRTSPRPRVFSGCSFNKSPGAMTPLPDGCVLDIHDVGSYIISVPPCLETLNISGFSSIFGNLINTLSFRNGENVLKIDISYNGIAYLSPVEGLDNLIYIDISGNNYLRLSDTFFDPFSQVEILKMNDQSMPQDVVDTQGKRFLKSLPKLKSFHICGNRLVQLPLNIFDSNPCLQNLYLSRNIFSSIPVDVTQISNLQVLDMASNSLGSLDSNTRNKLDMHYRKTHQSFHVNLLDNFFSCSCGNFQFLFWLKETNLYHDNEKNLSCLTQTGRITNTAEINNNFIQFWRSCTGEALLSVCIMTMILIICCLLLSLLVASNHTRLAHMVIKALQHQIPKPKREDFRRDVYVSYAEADYQWICHELCPALEDKNLTLYIWDRDSIPGDSIPDQIAENIPQCFKTILYFNANYETDPWSYMSMMVAINCVDAMIPERLILLLPDGEHLRIPDCLLEIVPESCIIHVPPGVMRNDPFWDKLNMLIRRL